MACQHVAHFAQPCFGETSVVLSHHESLLFFISSDELKFSVVIFFIWFPSLYFFISPIVLQILFCYQCLKVFDALKRLNIGNQKDDSRVIRIEICPTLSIEPYVHRTFILGYIKFKVTIIP